MPNNIAVSITADVADLQVKRAILSAELKTAQKDLNDFAKTANASGMTDALKTSMLASADAATKARSSIRLVDGELKTLTATTAMAASATGAETVATEAATVAHVNSRAATEGLVLVHEALSGRYTRMTGSAMILTQAMAGQERVASAVSAIMNPMVLVAGALAVGLAYLAFQEWEVAKASTATAEAFALSGRGMNETVIAVRAQVDALSQMPGVSRAAAQQLISFDAAHAQVDERLAEAANQLIPLYVKAFGKEGPEALNKLKEALSELEGQPAEEAIRKFSELNRTILNLTPSQTALVETFFRQRDAIGAVNQVLQDLAARGGGHIDDVNTEIRKTEDEIAKTKRDLEALQISMRNAFDPSGAVAIAGAMADAEARVESLNATLKRLRAEAAKPAGEDFNTAWQNSHQTLLSLRDSALKAKDAVQQLHDEMELRRKQTPDDPEVKDYFANQSRMDRDLERRLDPKDFKAAKAPDIVSTWTEQLHAAEVASGEFFKDETANELKFWQGKLALTTAGSKQWLSVQDKIFAAQKSLAHQSYDEHLASLNEQLQADHENWSKQQSDWTTKLAYIKSKYGEQSKEYHDAHREFERAEQDHEQRMAQVRRQAAQEQLAELQENLRTEQQMRAQALQAQEGMIRSRAQYSANPFAGAAAEQQVAQLQAKGIEQQIEALGREHAARSQILAMELADAQRVYGADSEQYAKAVAEKAKLDNQYFNQKRLLVSQAANQEIQAQQRIQQAWHSAIDPLVHSAGSAIMGLATKTMTWQQALISVGEAGLGVVMEALEKVAEKTIVNAIVSRTAQVASAQAGIAASAAQAGAAGVASMAGAPFPLDLTAPAFGAEMAAVAMSFSLGGFEKGLDVVPNDMVAQIHEGERIVPRSDNRRLIAAAEAANDPGARSSHGSGGDTHIHLHVDAVDALSVRRLFENNADMLTSVLKRQVRNLRAG